MFSIGGYFVINGASGKVLVARDITERERMNEQAGPPGEIVGARRKRRCASTRNEQSLTVISMYNHMTLDELPKNSSFHEHVNVIRSNTETCRKIIRELLDYARIPGSEGGGNQFMKYSAGCSESVKSVAQQKENLY